VVWSVHTGIQLESKGVPTAVIVTSEFAPMGEATARERGYDGLPLVVVPHPFDWLPRSEVEGIAENIVGEIIRILTSAPEELVQKYRDRWRTTEGYGASCRIETRPAGRGMSAPYLS